MHILVTGGCGYVGTVLTEKLLDRGYRVTVIDIMWFGNYLTQHKNLEIINGDIRDTSRINLRDVDVIIHLASVANDPCVELNPYISWEINVLATMRLADAAIRNNVKQFIYASSGSVYGIKEEDQVTEDLELVPISEYNKTKMVAERVLLSYSDDMIIQVVRPATVCGYSPRMRLDVSVNMLTMQALEKGLITVFGGTQTRPNIHIQDMTDLYLFMIDKSDKLDGIFNAGFENLEIMEIAKKITEILPAKISVTESNDPRSYRLSSDKLLSAGYAPQKKVDNAIKDIIEAYKSEKIRNEDICYNVKYMTSNRFI